MSGFLPNILEDEVDVSALNLEMIAAYYNISCRSFVQTTAPLFCSDSQPRRYG
jgi:hypothetical protein